MKTYGKFSKLAEEMRSESEAVKARWDRRERTERSEEGDEEISNEELRKEKDLEMREKEIGL